MCFQPMFALTAMLDRSVHYTVPVILISFSVILISGNYNSNNCGNSNFLVFLCPAVMSDRGDGDGQATASAEAARACHGNCFKPKKTLENKCTREMHFKMPKYLTDAFKTMFKMRGDGLLTDVILELESEEVRAHKLVLAAASPYFKVRAQGDSVMYSPDCVICSLRMRCS